MTKGLITLSTLDDIGDAIREKLGVETTYKPSQMAAAIGTIQTESELGTKTVTANGTYSAGDDQLDGYSSVTVNVANSYAAGDEGKVVSNGALVSQTSATKTQNGTYDTTLNNEIVVNVSGGGGGGVATTTVFDAQDGISKGFTYVEVYNGTEGSTPTYDSSGRIAAVGSANNRKFVGFQIDLTNVMYVIITAQFSSVNDSTGAIIDSDLSTIKTTVRGDITSGFDAYKVATAANAVNELVIDVESLSGSYYVGIIGYESGWSSWLSKMELLGSSDSGDGGSTNILHGTSEPSSPYGDDGDVYLMTYVNEDSITLPSGYQAIDSLAVGSTSGPYIDTGVYLSSTSYFEVCGGYTATPTNDTWFVGDWTSNKNSMYGYVNSKILMQIGNSGPTNLTLDTDHHVYGAYQDYISLDGVSVGSPNWSNVNANHKIFLFHEGSGAHTPTNNFEMKYAKIWNGSTLVRHMVAAKRTSDDALGMYDLINDVFYTNAGSGSFTVGSSFSDVLPENGTILATYLKVNGTWSELIGQNISSVNVGT